MAPPASSRSIELPASAVALVVFALEWAARAPTRAGLASMSPAELDAWLADELPVPRSRLCPEGLVAAGVADGAALARAVACGQAHDLDPARRLGQAYEAALPRTDRRRAGAHFTPHELARPLVASALTDGAGAGLPTVLDPAMGAGALLVEALEQLSERDPAQPRSRLACTHLFGLDLDGATVEVARLALWLAVDDPELPLDHFDRTLRVADALEPLPDDLPATFGAVVANPPWVAFAGRAAQSLASEQRAALARRFGAFARYPTLHGVFAERAAELTSPGGRIALLLPTSVADLDGYAPTRRAFTALAEVAPALESHGDGRFEGVHQPCCQLDATRRRERVRGDDRAWALRGEHLPHDRPDLRARIDRLQPFGEQRFLERGVQTDAALRGALVELEPGDTFDGLVPLLTGTQVRAFALGSPEIALPRERWDKLRWSRVDYGGVGVLVRQTARYPMACPSDGTAFRNSVLAGLAGDGLSAHALCAWLNATPIRWLHFHRHRDARQGMPQIKLSHLRGLPAAPLDARDALDGHGRALCGQPNDRMTLDALDRFVADLLGASDDELATMRRWRDEHVR